MKRSVIKRAKPLERKTALTRSPLARSALHAQQAERVNRPKQRPRVQPAVPAIVLLALTIRSGGLCEMALPGCTRQATDPAHRAARGMGGRRGKSKTAHDVLSNLTHACRRCHSIATAEPAWAYSVGLALPMGSDPNAEPVLYRGARHWLSDDGLVFATNPYDAEEAA